ncbi:hypothetical protein AB5J62_24910 [Amycolatopsis sp. cg5]|uniref:terpene synthase family protein n=1 Tax=Amycolatopsis sp. cg5 TaxID=3238802 RepID=UPI00352324DA
MSLNSSTADIGRLPWSQFDSLVHADIASISAHLDQCNAEIRVFSERQLREAKFAELVARMYPLGDVGAANLASEIVVWLFLVDDYLDDESANPDNVLSAVEWVVSRPATRPGEPMLDWLWRWCHRMVGHSSESWWASYSKAIVELTRLLCDEHKSRVSEHRPNLNEYLSRRRCTFGWGIILPMIDIVLGEELPAWLLSDYDHSMMLDAAGDIAAAANDLISFRKELAAGEFCNMVMIVHRDDHVSLDVAVQRTLDWMDSRHKTFISAKESLLSSGRDAVERRVRCVEALVRGTIDWSLAAARYSATGGKAPW